ncbi:hypothetical protein BJ165DRAFT_989706 [Panaeolus papilionaceus]|nr:hypothetical protein BJ165DRAFT_989706 [Panaeolus papilionaceus]
MVDSGAEGPPLPPELEHAIVNIAARDGIRFPLTADSCCLNLQLTCNRFREWTIPFLFRVIEPGFLRQYYANGTEPDDVSWPVIKTLDTFGHHTTHLSLSSRNAGETHLRRIINVIRKCPNVENMIIAMYDVLINRVSLVSLADVHEIVQGLTNLRRFTGVCGRMTTERLRCPVYLNLTHLDLVGYVDTSTLLEFKSLTHLCLDIHHYLSINLPDFAITFRRLMDPTTGYHALRVLIIMAFTHWNHEPQNILGDGKDPRLVFLHDDRENNLYHSWMAGANGGMDFWEFAERIVICRKRHYLIREQPQVIDMDHFRPHEELTPEGLLWWGQ